MGELPHVTIELDSGPVELAFGYAAKGDPAYRDVPVDGPWLGSYGDAENDGAKLVAIGNWRSFTVEKRYFVALKEGTDPAPANAEAGSVDPQFAEGVSHDG